MAIDLKNLTIKKAHEHLSKGNFTALELTQAYLKNIEKENKDVNAYLEVFDDAEVQAEGADARLARGEKSPLLGIPLAVKDNILIEGRIASSASKILENYRAAYDATAIKKLKEQGAVFLGRTNMDEFAMGGSTENSAFGVTRNPYDPARVSGGTSGGSAAAVAMNGALAALGSDTGGSIRQPSSFCGVVGLKPTYGRVSRSGLMAAASSFDQIGPIAKTAADAEALFDCIKGRDPLDSTTISDDTYCGEGLKGSKPTIGVPRHFMEQGGLDKGVLANFETSVEKCKDLGFKVVDIALPNIIYSLATYYIIIFAEESSNLARFDGVKYGLLKEGKNLLEDYLLTRGGGFGKEVRRRILLGTYVLSSGYYDAYYNKAQTVRKILKDDFTDAFKSVDAVLTPTTPSPAFKIGEKAADPLSMYLADVFTVTANLTGMPAISVPSGFADDGGKKLPLGMQFTAPLGREDTLFSIGRDFLGE